ncbi:MAG: hypothetical protein IPL47_15745 [Phyllobacteriaceae bacterium]|nr:hypothetical protein [Phyllobacteriaceae bacterium]
MWAWVNRNAEGLQAVGGLVAALFALTALIVIPWQINQADRIQREQGARDIYREFLNISIANPKLANADWCALSDANDKAAYEAYVEYLLYATEQLVGVDADWRAPMATWMADHAPYVCGRGDWEAYTPAVQELIAEFTARQCQAVQPCQ